MTSARFSTSASGASAHAGTPALLSDKLAEIDEQIQSLEDLRSDVRALIEDGVAEDASNCWPCEDQFIQIRPLMEGKTR